MATILVTGGCGLIGERVCSGLLKKGNTVIAVDREPSDYNADKENYFFRAAAPNEKSKYAAVFEEFNLDYVVHLACTVDNDLGPEVGKEQMELSAACDKFIYKLAIGKEIQKFILCSTTQVYRTPENREPVREDDPLKPVSNYAKMKLASEEAFYEDVHRSKTMICCILRIPPVYSFDFTDNLVSRITDPKDKTLFVFRTGEYGFHLCCIHNISDFIIGFLRQAEGLTYTGIYNVADVGLIMASEIITFMRENHRLGVVVQRSSAGATLKDRLFGNSAEKTNYRFLDMATLDKNFMFDTIKASRICPFRWNLMNTK